MLKQAITYTNEFTKETVTEEHWFHLYKATFVEIQMESLNEPDVVDPETGEKLEGFRAKLQRIIESKDGVAVVKEVKDLIGRSYGLREGNDFFRSPEITAKFEATQAYSQLLFDLCTDAEKQAAFVNGIMPHDLAQEAAKIVSESLNISDREEAATNNDASTPRTLTTAEAAEMNSSDLQAGLADGRYKLS